MINFGKNNNNILFKLKIILIPLENNIFKSIIPLEKMDKLIVETL